MSDCFEKSYIGCVYFIGPTYTSIITDVIKMISSKMFKWADSLKGMVLTWVNGNSNGIYSFLVTPTL